jgi:hypothetical protein
MDIKIFIFLGRWTHHIIMEVETLDQPQVVAAKIHSHKTKIEFDKKKNKTIHIVRSIYWLRW